MNTKQFKLTCLLSIFCLTVIILPAARAESPDFADRCSYIDGGDPENIALDSTTNGYITKGDDCDWRGRNCDVSPDRDYFRITVTEAGTLTIYTTDPASSPIMDTKGRLYDDRDCDWRDIIAENDDASTGNENFLITEAVGPGTYYIRVRGGHWDMQGNYTLHVEFSGSNQHTITASADTGGSISPAGAVGAPDHGVQTFTITPDACYEVEDVLVEGSSVGAQTSYTFTDIISDQTISASFVPNSNFTIDVTSGAGGNVAPATGPVTVNCGDNPTFTIAAAAGHTILDVKVDGVSVVDPLTVGNFFTYTFTNVMADHTLAASFTAGDHIITTIAGENGSIAPLGPVGVPENDTPTFSIAPNPGFEVKMVWMDGVEQGIIDTYTFDPVTGPHELEAEFEVRADRPPLADDTCIDISDVPLDTRVRAAPANIMFVLDDSGSMDWEVMTNQDNGLFDGEYYVFDDPLDSSGDGDNVYSGMILSDTQRKKWKSQWSGYNKMYYNPRTEYTPWPGKPDADTVTPWAHPHVTAAGSATLDLTDGYTDDISAIGETVVVDDRDAEFSIWEGAWEATGFHDDAINDNFTLSTVADELKKARWTPTLEVGEMYKVYARWVDDTAYSSQVNFNVYPDGVNEAASVTVDMTETTGGETYHYLGEFTFSAGGYVEIENTAPKAKWNAASADAVKFVPSDSITASIKNAHYYTWHDTDEDGALDSGETVYLVNFVGGTRQWFEFADSGETDLVEAGELTEVSESSVPEIVKPFTAADDLQNFANWYSFYRRRELTATAAVATVISNVQGMQIGIAGINDEEPDDPAKELRVPVHKIHVDGVDETAALLEKLYSLEIRNQTTPLRMGLKRVGQYFHRTDGSTGDIGTSPIADAADGGECQQCFAIVMTDGYYNGDTSPGVGNTDEDDPTGDPNSDFDGAPYADTYSNTLADVAMEYYENDLAPNLNNFVPTSSRDLAEHQHLVTYTIGFGVAGSLSLAPDYLDTGVYPTWTDPADGTDAHKIDDMLHAAVNGRGRYMSATNSLELINELYLILKDIAFYSGSASSVSVNGDELYTRVNDDVMLFQSKYYSQTWHGDVLAYQVDGTTGALVEPALWSAAKAMSLQSLAGRKIATYDGASGGIPFRFDNLNVVQKAMLDADWETTGNANARNILDFLRGDPTNELDNGGTFRNRTWKIEDQNHPYNGSIITSSRLGDIVHASPVYRDGVLYSGGNDGMLHAFDATSGEEFFAYVPNLVFDNLADLADPTFDHQFYVDLTPSIADVDFSGISKMLVGGLSKGGRGYYALDITNVATSGVVYPLSETDLAGMVMWEFPNFATTNPVVADLGYSYSKAEIVKSYDPDHPYILIFGNGYNSNSGKAVLFILDPETGQLIKRIDTGVAGCNGLSTPVAVDVDYDDTVDYVYAGDLVGNLWKFDLTNPDFTQWDVAHSEGGTKVPLFKAASQPITTRPDVMYHCEKDGYLVLFGTGQYLGDADLSDTDPQAVYGIWDYGDDADDGEYVGTFSNGTTFAPAAALPGGVDGVSLLAQNPVNNQTAHNLDLRTLSNNQPDWTTSTLNPNDNTDCGDHSGGPYDGCDPNGTGDLPDPIQDVGWYYNLPDSGERVVGDVIARDGNLIVISYTPGGSMCATGGHTWVMAMDACSGGRLAEATWDVNGDGVIDDQDKVDIGGGATAPPTGIQYTGRLQPPAILILDKNTETLYMSSSIGTIETQKKKAARLGMFYWNIFSQ